MSLNEIMQGSRREYGINELIKHEIGYILPYSIMPSVRFFATLKSTRSESTQCDKSHSVQCSSTHNVMTEPIPDFTDTTRKT